MDQREIHPQRVGDIGGSLRSSSVRRHDHTVLGSAVAGQDLVLDVLPEQVAAVEVVDGNVKEALILRVVQVHCDDVVGAGAGEKVCD